MSDIKEYKSLTGLPDPEKLKQLEQGLGKMYQWAVAYAGRLPEGPEKKQLVDFLNSYENL